MIYLKSLFVLENKEVLHRSQSWISSGEHQPSFIGGKEADEKQLFEIDCSYSRVDQSNRG
jgi:hypothetical protein